jgi:hypothetical protein
MALAKKQKDRLPEFCYGFNKEFGFFSSSFLPEINSSGVNSFYLYFPCFLTSFSMEM